MINRLSDPLADSGMDASSETADALPAPFSLRIACPDCD